MHTYRAHVEVGQCVCVCVAHATVRGTPHSRQSGRSHSAVRKHLILFHNDLYKRHSALANATAGDLWKETEHAKENIENLSAGKEREDVFRAVEMSRTEDRTPNSLGCLAGRYILVLSVLRIIGSNVPDAKPTAGLSPERQPGAQNHPRVNLPVCNLA